MECLFSVLVSGGVVVGLIAWAVARAGSAIDDQFGEDDHRA